MKIKGNNSLRSEFIKKPNHTDFLFREKVILKRNKVLTI